MSYTLARKLAAIDRLGVRNKLADQTSSVSTVRRSSQVLVPSAIWKR